MKEKIENELLKEMKKCIINNEVPVAALIVCNDKIIARGHNTKEKDFFVLNHAEVNAIKKACKKRQSWHLDDCVLYVTLKPCSMCQKIIENCHIKTVYYYLEKDLNKKEFTGTKYNFQKNELSTLSKELLHQFFKNMRIK